MNVMRMPMRVSMWAAAGWSLLALLAASQAGCATHADFVEVRDDLRQAVRAQDQAQKQIESLQRRLQAVETARESVGAPQQIEELANRLQELETRVARVEDYAARPRRVLRTWELFQ